MYNLSLVGSAKKNDGTDLGREVQGRQEARSGADRTAVSNHRDGQRERAAPTARGAKRNSFLAEAQVLVSGNYCSIASLLLFARR